MTNLEHSEQKENRGEIRSSIAHHIEEERAAKHNTKLTIDTEIINKSEYFDAEWYKKKYGLRDSNEAAKHYLMKGWKKGYAPSPLFDGKKYLATYRDVAAAKLNPLIHWERHGKKEGRKVYSVQIQRNRNPLSPKRIKRFIFHRKKNKNGLVVFRLFSLPLYVSYSGKKKRLSDLSDLEIVKQSEYFDAKWYRTQYRLSPFVDAAKHYLNIGWKSGYSPSPSFDGSKYLTAYPDIKKAHINPLIHWLRYGKTEGRYIFSISESDPEIYFPENYSRNNKAKNVLLVSHVINHTGAPILLLETAKMLREAGYNVYVLSPIDGDLKAKLLSAGIPVFICVECALTNWNWRRLPIDIDFCLCNTVLTWAMYGNISHNVPTIWWVHENVGAHQIPGAIQATIKKAKSIYVPGSLTATYYRKYNKKIKLLPYPIRDRLTGDIKNNSGKIKFSVLGVYSSRKAQDTYVKAVNLLHDDLVKRAEFEIIGERWEPEFCDYLDKLLSKSHRVTPLKPLNDFESYHEYVDSLDVVCCPSTEDPFPLVVIDGMMHGKLCVVSDHVGQSKLITNGQNGYVFPVGDEEVLASIFTEIINNRENLITMQKRSRALFEREFNYSICKKILCEIIRTS